MKKIGGGSSVDCYVIMSTGSDGIPCQYDEGSGGSVAGCQDQYSAWCRAGLINDCTDICCYGGSSNCTAEPY